MGDRMLQWSRHCSVAETPMSRAVQQPGCTLQWSRHCSVAETRLNAARCNQSPRKLQWSRHCSVAETSIGLRCEVATLRFNGAATVQWRKHLGCVSRRIGIARLQWSRHCSVAETHRLAIYADGRPELQWSRHCSV